MRFEKETTIAAPPASVFAFHESPGALLRLTPPWEHVRQVEGGLSLRPGSQVTLETRLGPFRLRWLAEHTEYDPPRRFADRQVKGPFARWEHRHHFLEDGSGGTILRDEVDYELPLGPVGRLLGARYVRRKLERLFNYRHETTRRIVESGDFTTRPEAASPTARP